MRYIKPKWWIWLVLALLFGLVAFYLFRRYYRHIRPFIYSLPRYIEPQWWPWVAITILIGLALIFFVRTKLALPLDSAAKNRRHTTQFTIVDFLCLFVLVQVPMALIHSIKSIPGTQPWAIYFLDVYAWISIGLIWWKSAQIMSRAGINTPKHRVILLLVVLPVALIAPLLPVVFIIVTAIGMVTFATNWGFAFTTFCIALGIPIALFFCVRLVHRIVDASEALTPVPVEVVEEEPQP